MLILTPDNWNIYKNIYMYIYILYLCEKVQLRYPDRDIWTDDQKQFNIIHERCETKKIVSNDGHLDSNLLHNQNRVIASVKRFSIKLFDATW